MHSRVLGNCTSWKAAHHQAEGKHINPHWLLQCTVRYLIVFAKSDKICLTLHRYGQGHTDLSISSTDATVWPKFIPCVSRRKTFSPFSFSSTEIPTQVTTAVWIIILSHTPCVHPAHLLPIYLGTIKANRNIIFLLSKPYRKFSALFVQMMPMENLAVVSVSVLSGPLQHGFLGSLCQYAKFNND